MKKEHDAEVAAERSVNERYHDSLLAKEASGSGLARQTAQPANQSWVDHNPNVSQVAGTRRLTGRVALNEIDEMLGSNFYIGPTHTEFDDKFVVSWAAPMAELFFSGRSCGLDEAHLVTARRSFEGRAAEITDIADDWYDDVPDDKRTFGHSKPLTVPAPPSAPTSMGTAARVTADPEPAPTAAEEPLSDDRPVVTSKHQPEAVIYEAPTPDNVKLRAEPLVKKAIARPRTGKMAERLATLQPDQFALVSWPATKPLVVQGQPGTGKTIVATHRAAYLTNPDRQEKATDPVSSLLYVGPSALYATHIARLNIELGGGHVATRSLDLLMHDLSGAPAGRQSAPILRHHTSLEVGHLIREVAESLRTEGRLTGNVQDDQRLIVDALFNPATPTTASADDELREMLKTGVSWERAVQVEQFVTVLAAARLAAGSGRFDGHRYDHLVVDEAQDLRPLEWQMLLATVKDRSAVSIFGDMHQRRSDFTASTWKDLLADLELIQADEAFKPEEVSLGYRSTRQIISFASKLLPKANRRVDALMNGPEPDRRRSGSKKLHGDVVAAVNEFSERHPNGIVAVISTSPRVLQDAVRSDGWAVENLPEFSRDGRRLTVLSPDQARGLEYDAVIVVEPHDFPAHDGRHGSLYTSLTRATQELMVIYSKKLPKALHASTRRGSAVSESNST